MTSKVTPRVSTEIRFKVQEVTGLARMVDGESTGLSVSVSYSSQSGVQRGTSALTPHHGPCRVRSRQLPATTPRQVSVVPDHRGLSQGWLPCLTAGDLSEAGGCLKQSCLAAAISSWQVWGPPDLLVHLLPAILPEPSVFVARDRGWSFLLPSAQAGVILESPPTVTGEG